MTSRVLRRPCAGFTLVEIMIALLIGLIALIVIMQTYAVSEGYKRTSSSGSDAQTNGGIALYMVEREVRNAGYGFNAISSQCPTMAVYTAATGKTASVPVSPSVQINPAGIPAGDANTDVLLVAYGSSDGFAIPVGATQAGNETSDFSLSQNFNAVRSGDLLVAFNGAGVPGGSPCLLSEATAVPYASGNCNGAASSGGIKVVKHASGGYANSYQSCATVNAQHNPATSLVDPGLGKTDQLGSSGNIFNLGPSPQVKAYAVRGGNLTVCDLLAQDCTVAGNFAVAMNDIVSLRAVLGHDNTGPTGTPDGKIDFWSRNPGANNDNVLAVALEVTARSPLSEKASSGSLASASCDTTVDPAKPDLAQNWFGPSLSPADGTVAASEIDLSSLADWKCYRYKLFQTTVPVRNAIWTPNN